MGNLRSLKRKLKPEKMQLADEMLVYRNNLAKLMVAERVKEDAEFAKDVLKAVGKDLPEEIRKSAEETIARKETKDEEAKK